MINFYQTEIDVMYSRRGDKSFIESVIADLMSYKKQIDYNCSRFIDQYGSKLDVERSDKYHKFLKIQSEEYSKITRLERVINAYAK